MNHVMNFVAQSPEGQRVLSSLLGSGPPPPGVMDGAGGGLGLGLGAAGMVEAPVFQAARQGEVAVVEQLLGPTRDAELSAQLSQAGDVRAIDIYRCFLNDHMHRACVAGGCVLVVI
jgi:hypothetical protein